MIEGLSSIAVFTENSTLFDHAMAMWRARVPAYFYIGSDGPQPRSVASCGAKLPYWSVWIASHSFPTAVELNPTSLKGTIKLSSMLQSTECAKRRAGILDTLGTGWRRHLTWLRLREFKG